MFNTVRISLLFCCFLLTHTLAQATKLEVADLRIFALTSEEADQWQLEASRSENPTSLYQFIRSSKRSHPKNDFLGLASDVCRTNGFDYAYHYELVYFQRPTPSPKFDVFFDWVACDRNPLVEPNAVQQALSKLRILAQSGNKLKLILGRTNTPRISDGVFKGQEYPPLSQAAKEVWVFGDLLPGLSGPSDPIQLTMNFDDLDNLKVIDNALFDQIIVDAGVWHHLENTESNIKQYSRMLKNGGRLVVERYPYIVGMDATLPKGTYTFDSDVAPRVLFVSARDATQDFSGAQRNGAAKMSEKYSASFRSLGYSDLKIHDANEAYPIQNRLFQMNPYFGYLEFIK